MSEEERCHRHAALRARVHMNTAARYCTMFLKALQAVPTAVAA
jgi:hypothetical protein